MITFLTYDIKAAVLIAVFYVFYRILLSKETFHRMNRVVLLSTAVLSFALPLCIITTHRTEIISVVSPTISIIEGGTTAFAEPPVPSQPWWQTAIVAIYIIGVAVVMCKILISLVSILRLVHSAQDVREYQGSRLIISDTRTASFSWMNNIIIGRDDYEQGIGEILDHEKAHIGLRHSWDILLVDLVSAVQWFNPAIWMLRSDLRAVHEYEADEAVFLKGVDVKHYQYLLVSKAMADSGFSITNQFNHSNLKSRINMMTKKKSSKCRALKVLYILPVVGISLAVSAKTVVDYQYEEIADPSAQGLNTQTADVQSLIEEETDGGLAVNDSVKRAPLTITFQDGDTATINPALPLIVINGVAVGKPNSNAEFTTMMKAYNITPDDIESLTVLKDAAATAVWGEKGMDGVIEIKTKDKKQRSDIAVDELAKKLPGAEKSEDGSFKVNGKPVNKVLVNGEKVYTNVDDIFSIAEQMPELRGGQAKLIEIIGQNLRYPELAKKLGVEGRVVVQFVIDKTGNVSNCNAISFNGPGDTEKYIGGTTEDGAPLPSPDDKEKFIAACETARQQMAEEAIRIIKATDGQWTPGMQRGQAVNVKYVVPVTFKLD